MLIQDLIGQGAFPGAGYTGHAGKDTQRDLHIDVLQVILPRALYGYIARGLSPLLRDRDGQLTA